MHNSGTCRGGMHNSGTHGTPPYASGTPDHINGAQLQQHGGVGRTFTNSPARHTVGPMQGAQHVATLRQQSFALSRFQLSLLQHSQRSQPRQSQPAQFGRAGL
eukprot:1861006-Alexandrium_andersonii.AAC.1